MTIFFNLLKTYICLPWATRAKTASTAGFTCIMLDYGKIIFSLFSTEKERELKATEKESFQSVSPLR